MIGRFLENVLPDWPILEDVLSDRPILEDVLPDWPILEDVLPGVVFSFESRALILCLLHGKYRKGHDCSPMAY